MPDEIIDQPETESTDQDAPDLPDVETTESNADEPGLMTPAESDDEEIDYEGEKYKVPKVLKDAFLRQADYTTKTQSLAQQRQDFEAAQQQLAARAEFQQRHIEKIADVRAIDRQLEQFSKVDWNALTDADPVQALKLDRQMRELQTQRAQTVGEIEREQGRQQLEASQATARQLQEARALLAREIKGYGTPEVTKALTEVGKQAGYKAEELAQVNDPRAIKLLHKAYLYDQLVAQRKAPEAKPEVTPITRVTGGSAAAAKSIADPNLSDAEYNRLRREYIRKYR